MDASNDRQPSFRGTAVGEVLDANNTELKVFIENFKKEYRQQWQSTASAILKSVGIYGSVAEILQIGDVCELENCASPVRKKQKSNDYGKPSTRLPAVAPSSTEPPQINHGLSDEELVRIHKLKRADLMEEIEEMGGEYHKSWSKGHLVEALLSTYAMFNLTPTEVNGCSIMPSTESKPKSTTEKDVPAVKSTVKKASVAMKKQNVISDFEMVSHNPISTVVASAVGENDQKETKLETARSIADAQRTDNGKNEVSGSKKSNSVSSNEENGTAKAISQTTDDDCMNVSMIVEPPNTAAPSTVQEVICMELEEPSTIKSLLQSPSSGKFDEDIFESAKENLTQSHQSYVKQHVTAKYFTPALSQLPGSDVKPTRSSPSVPIGIVDSAKKQLLSSQKKIQTVKSQHFAHSIVAQKLDLEQKVGSYNKDASLSNRNMAMPTFDNGNAPLIVNSGFSEKVKASTVARNERIAHVKALSKKTIHKAIPTAATSGRPGINLLTVNSKANTLSSSKLEPNDRFAELRAKHNNQKDAAQATQSITKPMPITEVTYSLPNPVATIKRTLPTLPEPTKALTKSLTEEFVSYEMTDGEYDSDDDEASAARAAKRIPDWARSANLTKALEVQYSKNVSIDPDELFGEVETCNLEAIFGLTYPKFRRRNSSGDWTKHRVTSEEKRMYKRRIENS